MFAYLKRFKGQEELLSHLQKCRVPTLVYLDGGGPSLSKFECDTLRFAKRRLDISLVSKECDLAILNAGHGETAEMLLAGKPILQLPLAFEQRMIADAIVRLGAAESASLREPKTVIQKLDRMLDCYEHQIAAEKFRERYSWFDANIQRQSLRQRAASLVSLSAKTHNQPIFLSHVA